MRLIDFLLIEDKSRFIKKNKNLSSVEKEKLIHFFKINRQAEKKIDWNKAHEMDWEDFEDVMLQFRSGRKEVVKHAPIPGVRENEDYVRIKLKRKDYLAYAIKTWEGSQAIASGRVGPCRGTWCVAHSDTAQAWRDYAHGSGDVFIYVMNADEKWAIQLHDDDRSYVIWDSQDRSGSNIPGFDVKKELLTSKLKMLYNDIRNDYDEEDLEIDVSEETEEYDQLLRDIDNMPASYQEVRDNFHAETEDIRERTIELHRDDITEIEEKQKDIEEKIDILKLKKEKTPALPTAKDIVDYDGQIEKLEAEWDELDEEAGEILDIIDEIEAVELYEMSHTDAPGGKDWIEDPPDEDYIMDDVEMVNIHSSDYAAYFELCENHFGFYMQGKEGDNLQQEIYQYMWDEGYGTTPQEILSKHSCYHPDAVNEM